MKLLPSTLHLLHSHHQFPLLFVHFFLYSLPPPSPLYILSRCLFTEFHVTLHHILHFRHNYMSIVELFHSHYIIHKTHNTQEWYNIQVRDVGQC